MTVVLACLAGLAAGAFLTSAMRPNPVRADDRPAAHGKAPAGVKAPIEEILHCPSTPRSPTTTASRSTTT
jgi:hypothetical protein